MSVAAKICVRTSKTDSQQVLQKYEYGLIRMVTMRSCEENFNVQGYRSGPRTPCRTRHQSGERGRSCLRSTTVRGEPSVASPCLLLVLSSVVNGDTSASLVVALFTKEGKDPKERFLGEAIISLDKLAQFNLPVKVIVR